MNANGKDPAVQSASRRRPLELIAGGRSKPLDQVEAELMLDTIDWLRPRLSQLPLHSALRADWLAALDDVSLAATLQWPSAGQRAAAAPQ